MTAEQGENIENDPRWLARLHALNAVIAAAGEPVAGNLCYDHNQADFVDGPPAAFNRLKRERFRLACAPPRTRMLEVGVNGGHSAYIALSSNPTLEYHGVDIAEHGYVRPAVEWLQAEFPHRVRFHAGDCLAVLPLMVRRGERFDIFHVDGGKHTYYRDILNCHRMLEGEALLVMDDTNKPSIARVWDRCMRNGLIEPAPGFPDLPSGETHANAIGLLPAVPASRLMLLRARAQTRNRWRTARLRLRV